MVQARESEKREGEWRVVEVVEVGWSERREVLRRARVCVMHVCLVVRCAYRCVRWEGGEGREEGGGGRLLSESTASLCKEPPLIVCMRMCACPRLSAYTCMCLPCAGGRQRQRTSDICQDVHVSLSGCVEWRSRRLHVFVCACPAMIGVERGEGGDSGKRQERVCQ